jgi:Fe-S cluster assembly protein SufD
MSEKAFKNINKLPVRTWRWLDVNDISVECTVPEIRPYEREYIFFSEQEGLEVIAMGGSTNNLSVMELNDVAYGISEELKEMAKKEFNAGTLVHVKRGIKVKEPIILRCDIDSINSAVIDNNVIVAEENSEVTIVFVYKSVGETEGFHNGLTRIYAKEGSKVNITKVQLMNDLSYNFDAAAAAVAYGAKVSYVGIELGAKHTVVNYKSELKGENSEADLQSIYLGDKDRNIDLNYVATHIGRRSLSSIVTHGVLMDECKKIFKATLDFKKGASDSKGREEEFAILLSPKARNKAVPLLLCGEENVEGAHAASAGKIDDNKLFYLMSRGFSEKEAKKLIIEAAFNPVIDKVPAEDIREEIGEFIGRRLLDA